MVEMDEEQVAEIRENVHTLSNALNTISMQAELARMLSADCAAQAKIAACIDVIADECKKGGVTAHAISGIVKRAADSA